MSNVAVNPPKSPVTTGSMGIAAATVPNVCKMPGPPAPFVPTPLPNIGKSNDSPKGYTKKVKVGGKPVAIRGATFKSTGDVASKGTGGGLVSANTHGPTKFVTPGSLDVKFEGKNVQLLSDMMLNNCGPSGNPPNSATMGGILQNPVVAASFAENPDNEDHCGAGNHSEEVQRPKVPPNEADPQKRIDKIAAMATTTGDAFEAKAAQYNLDKGHLTHGSQMSREITPEEKAAGLHPDDQKVWMICTVCKHRREADEAPDDDSTVEAKSTAEAVTGGKQKANNAKRIADGNQVTYKSPPVNYDKYKEWTEAGFKMVSLPKQYL